MWVVDMNVSICEHIDYFAYLHEQLLLVPGGCFWGIAIAHPPRTSSPFGLVGSRRVVLWNVVVFVHAPVFHF